LSVSKLRSQATLLHAVIFDIDGTLLRSAAVDDSLYREAVQSVLGPVRFRESLAQYDFVTDSGVLSQILDDNSIPFESDCTAAIKAHFVTALNSHISESGPFQEIPGAKDVLEMLRNSRQHAVGIATGGWRESAVLKLRSSGFDISGFSLATSDESFERTEIMRIALSNLGSDFRSITYYGDGAWDRDACAALGWRFVAVGPALGGIDSYTLSGFA